MDLDTQLDDAATRPATLTPVKDMGDGNPSAEAREQARLIRKQRNARVEAWRDIVAVSASDCTCIGSSPPSSFVDSTASWGAAASNTTAAGELPSIQEPVDSPATTASAWKPDGPGSASAAPQCRHCCRLGAPSFMGEKEVDEYAEIPQQRRTSSISRMLKQLTTRIGLGDRRASDKRPPIPRGADQGAAVAPPPGATAGVQPTSRDSFAESRKNKMKQTHCDRQRHEHHGSSGGKKRSVFGGKASLDLNQVNEALKTQMPAGHSENLTYRRAGQCAHSGMRSSSSPPRGDKQADDSLSLSTNEEDAAANPVVTQRMRQAARSMERMARAQQLLNRVKDLGDPCVDETPSSRPQASSGKGNPMARRAAPPVQAPA